MFKRIFKWDQDDNGIDGWILKDMPHFDAAQGLGVAHDTLEHFDNGVELEDEMQAFGAIVYGRVEGYYWEAFARRHRAPAETLASDLSNFLFGQGQIRTLPDRVTRPLKDEEHDTEAFLADVSQYTLNDAMNEWDRAEDENGYIELTEEQKDEMRETMRRAISWMRVGYRRAARRWSRSNREAFASMFHDMELTVDNITKQGGDFGEFQTNDELHVSVSRDFDFVVKVVPYRDPYA